MLTTDPRLYWVYRCDKALPGSGLVSSMIWSHARAVRAYSNIAVLVIRNRTAERRFRTALDDNFLKLLKLCPFDDSKSDQCARLIS